MATFSRAVIDGHHDPMDIARTLVAMYGARDMKIALDGMSRDSFRLIFEEAVKPEQKHLRPHERRGRQRDMSMLTNGYGSGDYADLTTAPATSFLLGWGVGDEDVIFETLARFYGGWTQRYDQDDWTRYERQAKAA